MIKFLKNIKFILVGLAIVSISQSCTDLNEEVYDQLNSEVLFDNPDNLVYAFGGAYTNMYGLIGHKFQSGADCGTDLLVVPQRGGDWEDGGEWHRYHWLTWTADDGYVSRAYTMNYKGIVLVNTLIATFESSEADATEAISELRGLRAYYYLNLIDLFGNIIINDQFPVEDEFPTNSSRAEVFAFIENELLESMPYLSKQTGANYYGRINYYVAQTLLAKLYLNAEVYTGTPQWAKSEAAIDTIMAGPFALEASIFDNFVEDATGSSEHIFGVPFDQVKAQALEIHLFTLHYATVDNFEITEAGWNGLSAQESLYNLLAEDANDNRLNGLLYGPQFRIDDGSEIVDDSYEKFPAKPFDPDGPQLNHTPEINMLQPNCLRQAGARIKKYNFVPGTGRYMGNDVPVYRYADILLMKAEVLLRQGDAGAALPYVNQIRERSGATLLGSITEQTLLDERARELFVEGHRRSDLIRFEVASGVTYYTGARWEKPEVSESYRMLWPIPANEIGLNANLVQNSGY